jgi:hypothetical protein
MLDAPKTKEDAQKYRYHCWAGNPSGREYQEGYCAYEVWAQGRGISCHQCSRKNGHGPDGLYCKQHSKKI